MAYKCDTCKDTGIVWTARDAFGETIDTGAACTDCDQTLSLAPDVFFTGPRIRRRKARRTA